MTAVTPPTPMDEGDIRLFHALKRKLIDHDFDTIADAERERLPALRDTSGRSLLFYLPSPRSLDYCVSSGCDIDLIDNYRQNILFRAVAESHTELVTAILSHRPDMVLHRDSAGKQPVLSATNMETLSVLIKHGASLSSQCRRGDTLVHTLSRLGAYQFLRQVFESASFTKELVVATNKLSRTPLHYACEHGHIDIVSLLLRHGADIHATDCAGWTVTHLASLGSWPEHQSHSLVLQLLIDNGANINATDHSGLSPLHIVSDTVAARLLVVNGANIEALSLSGLRPIHLVSHDTTIMLLEYHCTIDPRDLSLRSPLHYATEADKVDYLVRRGCVVNALDVTGLSALDCAVDSERHEVAEALRQHGGRSGRDYGIHRSSAQSQRRQWMPQCGIQ